MYPASPHCAQGMHPLHYACVRGHWRAVQHLITCGASKTALTQQVRALSNLFTTSFRLNLLATHTHQPLVFIEFYFSFSPFPSLSLQLPPTHTHTPHRQDGRNALHLVSMRGDNNSLQFLIHTGADQLINVQDKVCFTQPGIKARQGKQFNTTQDNSFFQRKEKRAALGGIRTHDTLLSRQALYQLSYR